MQIKKDLIKANFTKGRTNDITEITVHHVAGKMSLDTLWAVFNNPQRKGSCNYAICNYDVRCFVEETDTSWCNSNWESNCRAVTIEVMNSKLGPNWEVSDESLETIVALVFDIAKRNDLYPLVVKKNLTMHKQYKATACPGPYLESKFPEIALRVNNLLEDYMNKENEDKKPLYRVRKIWSDAKTQQGAFENLDNAIRLCENLNPYSVYDENGKQVYPK